MTHWVVVLKDEGSAHLVQVTDADPPDGELLVDVRSPRRTTRTGSPSPAYMASGT